MRRGKIVLILLLAAIACFLTGVLIWGIRAGQGDFGESLRRSFSLGRGERTQEVDLSGIREICLDYGSVDLHFSREGGSQMVLTEIFSGDPKEENFARIQRDEDSGRVTVTKGKDYGAFWFFSFGSGISRAEITLPEEYAGKLTVVTGSGNVEADSLSCSSLSLTAGSGDIRLDQLDAALTVHTGSGNLQTCGCRGSLEFETGSGDVQAENQEGAVRGSTGSGDVELPGGSGSRAVKTGSGDVLLDCGGEAIQVETSSGDVHIRNLADASFSLETETGSGDLEGAVFRELGADEDAKRFQGVYGASPEFQIRLRTGSGDMRLE